MVLQDFFVAMQKRETEMHITAEKKTARLAKSDNSFVRPMVFKGSFVTPGSGGCNHEDWYETVSYKKTE